MFNRGIFLKNKLRVKGQIVYTLIPVLYMLVITAMGFYFIRLNSMGRLSISKVTMIQFLQLFAPYISLFWILPIQEERIYPGWSEIFLCYEKGVLGDIVIRNVIYGVMLMFPIMIFSRCYGSMVKTYFELLLLMILFQGVGLWVLTCSKTMITAFLALFLYICLSLFLLAQPEMPFIKGYIVHFDISFFQFLVQNGIKVIAGLILGLCALFGKRKNVY